MNKYLVFLFSITILFTSCKQNKKELSQVEELVSNIDYNQDSEAYILLKTKCYICHSVDSKSHDNIIAPPMVAVKKRYLRIYDDKQSFVNAFSEWSVDPKKENAIMRGAVAQFNVMPNQNFTDEEIRKIATYIFDNELEYPEWFESHEESMHGKGMGRGNGRGMRRGQL